MIIIMIEWKRSILSVPFGLQQYSAPPRCKQYVNITFLLSLTRSHSLPRPLVMNVGAHRILNILWPVVLSFFAFCLNQRASRSNQYAFSERKTRIINGVPFYLLCIIKGNEKNVFYQFSSGDYMEKCAREPIRNTWHRLHG